MKIYISWSGERSRSVARILREFISFTYQNADIFSSTDDIPSGASWLSAVSRELNEADIGILCLTSDNIGSPWINFEAGALSSSGKRLIPVLLDLSPADLSGPLSVFQAVSFTKLGIKSLLKLLNSESNYPQPYEYISRIFDKLWPEFQKAIMAIPPSSKEISSEKDTQEAGLKSERQLLYELLERVKNLEAKTLKSD